MSTASKNIFIFKGWSLTFGIAIILLINFVGTLLVLDSNSKETYSFLIQTTARLSFVLFMSAFIASSLFYYVKNSFTRWLVTNRRYIGVSFAISHYLHLGALLLMTLHIDFNVFEDRGLFRTSFGAIAYIFITVMTFTSFDSTRNVFGAKNWKRIHTFGGYLLWIIFAKSYILNMNGLLQISFALIAITVLLLRISVLFKKIK